MTTSPGSDGFKICLFSAGGMRLALRLGGVAEILPMAALSRPPGTPAILEGFLNLGGAAVPVVRLTMLLGLPSEPLERHTPLLIVRAGSQTIGLLVARVFGIASTSSAAMAPIGGAESFNGCIDGDVMSDGQGAHLLSLDRLMLTRERETIAQYQAVEARRLGQLEPSQP